MGLGVGDVQRAIDDIAALADRVERLTVALRGLAAHVGADIHVDLDSDGLIDAMTHAGEDAEAVARG